MKVYTESAGNSLNIANPKICEQKTFSPNIKQRGGFRILVLLTDGFGGHGGIAKFNRDLLTALCAHPDCAEVVAIPRLMPNPSEPRPKNLIYVTNGLNSKFNFMKAVKQSVINNRSFDLVICGHINLMPAAQFCKIVTNAPTLLVIHGIDAWHPTRSRIANFLASKIDAFISVSEVTKGRFLNWTHLPASKGFILPNCINISAFGPGPKSEKLLKRYDLSGKTVIMTFGRLVSRERYKGFDEVLDLLSELAQDIPDIAYLIAGDGDDRPRLEKKASMLGVADRVKFCGQISEAEKVDHYRLADAYVMPSRGEGFGIVLLEAMACGVPVVASKADGSREALRDGLLGILVDPADHAALKDAVRQSLQITARKVPEGLDYFSFTNFSTRLHQIVTTGVRITYVNEGKHDSIDE